MGLGREVRRGPCSRFATRSSRSCSGIRCDYQRRLLLPLSTDCTRTMSLVLWAPAVRRQILPAIMPVRGYKKDMDRPKVVFGELMPKIPIYYSFDAGKRESDPDAIRRFYRLHWGGWIRPKAGRRKKLWYRPGEEHWWMRQHIFCSDDQSAALEKMITPEYKKQRHFVDDIYAPYHKRHGFESIPRGKKRVVTNYFDLMYEY